MKDGKKVLLVLGGISVLNNIVRNAQKEGYYVIVVDNLVDSPAKKVADESWLISIDDVEKIVEMAREHHVDGVMNYCVDPAQKPYQEICTQLGLPCVAGYDQFDILTNKDKFADCCRKYCIPVVNEYSLSEHQGKMSYKNASFPLIVKPADSRASKGLSICHSEDEVEEAIKYAMSNSKRKKVILQEYINAPEVMIKYIACDGEIFLSSMADIKNCYTPGGIRVYMEAHVYPSEYYQRYLEDVDSKIKTMLKGIGIKNGAISLTAFYNKQEFVFFDMALRMGGGEDWTVVKAASGIDISSLLTNFAISGNMGDINVIKHIDKAFALRNSCILYFDIQPGTIGYVSGFEQLNEIDNVVDYHICHKIGDTITGYGTANNVFGRVIISAPDNEKMIGAIRCVRKLVSINDTNGMNMIVTSFEV